MFFSLSDGEDADWGEENEGDDADGDAASGGGGGSDGKLQPNSCSDVVVACLFSCSLLVHD